MNLLKSTRLLNTIFGSMLNHDQKKLAAFAKPNVIFPFTDESDGSAQQDEDEDAEFDISYDSSACSKDFDDERLGKMAKISTQKSRLVHDVLRDQEVDLNGFHYMINKALLKSLAFRNSPSKSR